MSGIITNRLIIRSFTLNDWKGIQALAIDKESYKSDPHDPSWPTSDKKCKAFVEYLVRMTDKFFAVCLKSDNTLIGLLSFTYSDGNRQLELGYQIHSKYQDNNLDREALEGVINFAFELKNVLSIDSRTNPEWIEQIAPLKSSGFTPIEGDPGHLGITRENWRIRNK